VLRIGGLPRVGVARGQPVSGVAADLQAAACRLQPQDRVGARRQPDSATGADHAVEEHVHCGVQPLRMERAARNEDHHLHAGVGVQRGLGSQEWGVWVVGMAPSGAVRQLAEQHAVVQLGHQKPRRSSGGHQRFIRTLSPSSSELPHEADQRCTPTPTDLRSAGYWRGPPQRRHGPGHLQAAGRTGWLSRCPGAHGERVRCRACTARSITYRSGGQTCSPLASTWARWLR
jgi:hypothetical protein